MDDFASSGQPIRLRDVLNLMRHQVLVATSSSAARDGLLDDEVVITPELLKHLLGHIQLKYSGSVKDIPRIFVSHSQTDEGFCRHLVSALRDAGADVWYDEHNLDGDA